MSDSNDHLALALVPGLGPKLTAALLARFGSPAAALRATAAELLEVPQIGEKLANSLVAAMRTVDVGPELALLEKYGVRAVPLGSAAYPRPLAAVPAPPPLLYVHGEWIDADANAVAVVGTRSCTPYGRRMAEGLARDLARAGFTVVSGLARGIDGVAHRAALNAGGRTVAALAGGLSAIYPPEHAHLADDVARQGCLITEAPMRAEPLPGMFPARNRIISGLSRGVIVVEGDHKSGAMITAKYAGDQGREVFAVPGAADAPASTGCLELIRNGARLVRHADDVIEDLKGISTADFAPAASGGRQTPVSAVRDEREDKKQGASPPLSPTPVLDAAQQRVYDVLAAKKHADELVRELGLSAGELSRVLLQLEMKKAIRKLPGNFYERR